MVSLYRWMTSCHVAERLPISRNPNALHDERQTFGQTLADKVARFGGLMSQNRQAARDRIAAGLDYEINLKAKIEIMPLHEKLDRFRVEHLEEALREQGEQLTLLLLGDVKVGDSAGKHGVQKKAYVAAPSCRRGVR